MIFEPINWTDYDLNIDWTDYVMVDWSDYVVMDWLGTTQNQQNPTLKKD